MRSVRMIINDTVTSEGAQAYLLYCLPFKPFNPNAKFPSVNIYNML